MLDLVSLQVTTSDPLEDGSNCSAKILFVKSLRDGDVAQYFPSCATGSILGSILSTTTAKTYPHTNIISRRTGPFLFYTLLVSNTILHLLTLSITSPKDQLNCSLALTPFCKYPNRSPLPPVCSD